MAGRSQLKKTKSAPNLASFVKESSTSIFSVPFGIQNTNFSRYSDKPMHVSIGPYNKGKFHLLEWEKPKLYFLNNCKLRSQNKDLLETLVRQLLQLEQQARSCYRGVTMSKKEFVAMILFDGCFVVELLYYLTYAGEIDEDNPFFGMPLLLPEDLLDLNNQLPYFVLELLFDSDLFPWEKTMGSFRLLALEFFADNVYSIPQEVLETIDDHGTKHLLDLFHSSLNPLTITEQSSEATYPEHANWHLFNSLIGKFLSKRKGSNGAIESVSRLRSLGIKFKSREAINFLDIKFQNNVLEIPSIEYTGLMETFLQNCVAWERAPGNESKSKYISDYVYFMGCLLKQPSDVAFLRSEEIIYGEPSSDEKPYLDKSLSDFFNRLGTEIGYISRDSYLSQQLTNIQWYCNSPMATFYLKFISDPMSSLPAFALFILIFSLVQTMRAIFSYLQ